MSLEEYIIRNPVTRLDKQLNNVFSFRQRLVFLDDIMQVLAWDIKMRGTEEKRAINKNITIRVVGYGLTRVNSRNFERLESLYNEIRKLPADRRTKSIIPYKMSAIAGYSDVKHAANFYVGEKSHEFITRHAGASSGLSEYDLAMYLFLLGMEEYDIGGGTSDDIRTLLDRTETDLIARRKYFSDLLSGKIDHIKLSDIYEEISSQRGNICLIGCIALSQVANLIEEL